MSLWVRLLDIVGSAWSGLEDLFARWFLKARREQRRLEAKTRRLGADALALGVEIWDKVDDLPFVPSVFKMPPLRNQFYGHGAFMGAAPALLADPRWRRILFFLMPDVYDDVNEALGRAALPGEIIPMFENNPVMCAFGVWRSLHSRRLLQLFDLSALDLSGMEWDVFLDGELVREWEQAPPEGREPVVGRLVDSMLVAHASTTDTVQEAIGLDQYNDVRKTRKTLLGGVPAGVWLDFFARALQLAAAPDLGRALKAMSAEPRLDTQEECLLHAFAQPLSTAEALEIFREVTGRERLSVILEIKSLRSTVELMGDILAELNRRGVHVAGVGSFVLEEIRGLSARRQIVGGRELDGPREVLFLHFAGDLQTCCDSGEVPPGQSVLFNGASLLEAFDADGDLLPEYRVKEEVIADLERYRQRFDLHIGLYVQEGDTDNNAAALLSELVTLHPDTFELGFAWGGLQDEVGVARGETPRLGYGSQKKLERVGRARQWEVRDP